MGYPPGIQDATDGLMTAAHYLAPPSYGPCRTRRSPFVRVGGDQSAPSRESAPRKPPTTARITTAATNSSAAMSDSPLAAGGAGGLHLAGGCSLAEQVIDVQLRHLGGVVQERRGHGVLLRCLHSHHGRSKAGSPTSGCCL